MAEEPEAQEKPEQPKEQETEQQTLPNGKQTPPTGKEEQKTIEGFAKELGFESPDELAKSYKEQQATITKLSQEKSELDQIVSTLTSGLTKPPPKETEMEGEGLEEMPEDRKSLEKFVDEIVVKKVHDQDIFRQIAVERAKNPEEFDRLKPEMLRIYQANPRIEFLPNAVHTLFEKAKTTMKPPNVALTKEEKDKIKQELLEEIKTKGSATMPASGTSSPGAQPTSDDKFFDEIIKAGPKGLLP